MKVKFLIFAVLSILAVADFNSAQMSAATAYGLNLPATCDSGSKTGKLFFKENDGLYYCSSPNTWTPFSTSMSGGAATVPGATNYPAVSQFTSQANAAKTDKLTAAINAVGSAPTTLLVDETVNLAGSISPPKTLLLKFTNGGKIVKSGSGKIAFQGIGFEPPPSPYQQIFAGFSPGDITFKDEMPSEISPVWFGAVAGDFGANGGTPPRAANPADTLNAVNTIAAAFTHLTQAVKESGTVIKFPAGDFWFSDSWITSKNFGIICVDNNTLWAHGTRLFFRNGRSGIVLKPNDYNTQTQRPLGNVIKNCEIRQDFEGYTDSVVKVSGLTMTYVSGADFSAPLNDGDTVTLGDGFNVVVAKQRRTVSVTVVNNSTTVTSPNANFTQNDVGANIALPNDYFHLVNKIASVTNPTTIVLETPLALGGGANGNPRRTENTQMYISSARVLDIAKPEFVLSLYPPTAQDKAKGYQTFVPVASNINRSQLYVGQQVVFQGGAGNTITRTITAVGIPDNANAVSISPVIPDDFVRFAGTYTLGTVQALNTANRVNATLNKWAGISIENASNALVDNVRVYLFKGDGIRVDTDQYQVPFYATSNVVSVSNSVVEGNASNGYHGAGSDSNAILISNLNAINNGGFGIYDEGFLGITVNAGHITDNISGSIRTRHNSTNASVFTGVYLEGAAPPVNLGAGSIMIGGANGVGFHPNSQHAVAFSSGDPTGASLLTGYGLVTRNSAGTMSFRLRANASDNFIFHAGGQQRTGGTPEQNLSNQRDSYNYVSDWGMGNGDLYSYGYIGDLYSGASNGWTLAWDVAAKAVLARKLRIGDGSQNTANYTEMTSAAAMPTTGNYARGAIVWNRNYSSGGAAGWINKTAGRADFEAIGAVSGGSRSASATGTSSANAANSIFYSDGANIKSTSALKIDNAGKRVANRTGEISYVQVNADGIALRTGIADNIVFGGTNGNAWGIGENGAQFLPLTNNAFDFGADTNRIKRFYGGGFVNLSPFTPSGSADKSGEANDVARDDNYIYVKTSTGWKRAALSAF